jgi:tRNA dimethylallyltransferase
MPHDSSPPPSPQTILVIAGPTASGKSAAALHLAENLGGTIINADAVQMYADLRVLSARPDADEMARAPHRLYGVMDGARRCSAGIWRQMAMACVTEVLAQGGLPILVGGTGLYLRTFMQGIAAIPDVPEPVRAAAAELHASVGGVAFREMLMQRDPETAARLQPGDRQRLMRAWEVVEATGVPLSVWQATPADLPPSHWQFVCGVLIPERATLYARCDARFVQMLDGGGLDEVQALLARGLDADLPVMKALGVPELAEFLAGRTPRDHTIEAAQRSTRNYAKRQVTWFRNQLRATANLSVIDAQESVDLTNKIFAFIRKSD